MYAENTKTSFPEIKQFTRNKMLEYVQTLAIFSHVKDRDLDNLSCFKGDGEEKEAGSVAFNVSKMSGLDSPYRRSRDGFTHQSRCMLSQSNHFTSLQLPRVPQRNICICTGTGTVPGYRRVDT